MVHLLSCNGALSTRIAAFSVVNSLLMMGFKSGNDRLEVKDPTSLLWHNCKPKRSPVRMLNIHGENNTHYDYWGEKEVKKRRLMPVVRWLVDWSMRSGCGQALGMPARWRGETDPVHRTELETGYIFEGVVENATIIKASYHCWPIEELSEAEEMAKVMKQLPPSIEDIMGSPSAGELDPEKVKKHEEELLEFEKAAKEARELKAKEAAEKAKAKAAADEEKRLGTENYKKRNFDAAIAHYSKAWELYKDITYLTNHDDIWIKSEHCS